MLAQHAIAASKAHHLLLQQKKPEKWFEFGELVDNVATASLKFSIPTTIWMNQYANAVGDYRLDSDATIQLVWTNSGKSC